LKQRGVESGIGTYHLPLTTYWRRTLGFKAGDYPGTDEAASRALALPLHTALSPDDQRRIAGEVQAALHQLLSAGAPGD
jgi:dTDP-4-amino-4,6-dideoxygalactose transaminase